MANGHQSSPQALAVGDVNGSGQPDAAALGFHQRADRASPCRGHVPGPDGHGTDTDGRAVLSRRAPHRALDRWRLRPARELRSRRVVERRQTYTPIAGCTGLPGTATECTWTPGQAGIGAPIRVTARDSAGNTASAQTTFSPVAPNINVTAPNINQFAGVGTTRTIEWSHNLPVAGTVRIELSRDGGGTYETLADSAPIGGATSGSFAWDVTGPTTSTARVRVTSNGSLAASGIINFAITTSPTLTVGSPSAGSTAYTTALYVSWTSNAGSVGTVRIEISRDGGSDVRDDCGFDTEPGELLGTDPWPRRHRCPRSRHPDGRQRAEHDSDQRQLQAGPADPRRHQPGGGCDVLSPGRRWRSPGRPVCPPPPGRLSSNCPAMAAARTRTSGFGPNNGTFSWVVTGPATSTAQVRVSLGTPAVVVATSATFAIAAASVTVTSPAAGATVYTGTSVPITWSTNLPATSFVFVHLSRDGGNTWSELGMSATNTGSITWNNVQGPATSAARVKVTLGGFTVGTSGTFAIAVPSLTVTSPAAGATLYSGASLAIAWSSNLPATSPVTVELSRDGGGSYDGSGGERPRTRAASPGPSRVRPRAPRAFA